jgi:outer membrane beta-barrel protein
MKQPMGCWMAMVVRAALCLFVFLTAATASAQVEDLGLGEAPRVMSIQPRPYRLGHEFQLGVGVLPLDAFYVGAVVYGSYTYHFSDFWAWEIGGAGYSLNFNTGLKDELLRKYGVAPVGGGGKRITLVATSSAIIKPLFGKLAIFNNDIVFSETFLTVGAGWVKKDVFNYPAAAVGLGLRFWSSKAFSIRFDIRDYLVFSRLIPENTLMMLLTASLNYYDRPDKPRG